MNIFVSESNSPAFNAAIEQKLLTEGHGDSLLLYINSPSVIVGRNQTIEAEVDTEFCAAKGIEVHKRLSGGGTVYHDMGNVNYAFICDRSQGGVFGFGDEDVQGALGGGDSDSGGDRGESDSRHSGSSDVSGSDGNGSDYSSDVSDSDGNDSNYSSGSSAGGALDKDFTRPIIDALSSFGVDAQSGVRKEIRVGGLKVSGTASHVIRSRQMFHGTLLYSTDLDTLARVLRGDPNRRGKGVASVPSRVVNLSQLIEGVDSADEFMELLALFFKRYYNTSDIVTVNPLLPISI